MDQTQLTEQDMVKDCLHDEKQMLSLYTTFLIEAACQNTRGELMRIMTESQQVQFEVFNAMKARGWYPVKQAPLPEVAQALQKAHETN